MTTPEGKALPACPGCSEPLFALPSPTDQEAFVCTSDDCPFFGMVFATLNLLRLEGLWLRGNSDTDG